MTYDDARTAMEESRRHWRHRRRYALWKWGCGIAAAVELGIGVLQLWDHNARGVFLIAGGAIFAWTGGDNSGAARWHFMADEALAVLTKIAARVRGEETDEPAE